MEFLRDIFTSPVRLWIYRVSLAVIALLGGYGLLEESKLPLIIAVVTAVLSVSMAEGNTDPNGYQPKHAMDKDEASRMG